MKRTTLALVLILTLLFSAMAGAWFVKPAMAETIIVPDDYLTIQAAIGNATAGDTVFVKSGTYNRTQSTPIIIDKPLSLIGENPDIVSVVQTGRFYPYPWDYAIIKVSASDVTISGFTIKYGEIGITIGTENRIVSRCKIIGNNILNCGEGIVVDGKQHVISGNNIAGSASNGIDVWSSSDSIISENNITGSGWSGITIGSGTNVTIIGNSITRNGASQTPDFTENKGGLNLRWTGPFHVYENNITDNQGYGIQFGEGCHNSVVSENNIERNSIGINLLNFGIVGDATIGLGNVVYRNNMINNSQQAVVNKKWVYDTGGNLPSSNGTDVVSWDNGSEGNYWSDYKGGGLYIIDGDNIDHHPLMQPVDVSKASSTPSSPESFSIALVAGAAISLVVVGAGLLIYFRKRNHYEHNKHSEIEQYSTS